MIEIKQETETSAIASRTASKAIATLEAKRIRPVNPEADSAFALLVELVGAAPENLEQQQIYQAKLEAAKMSLKLAVEICEHKSKELEVLQQENRHEQANLLLQELLAKAEKFNAAIDSSFNLSAEMKTLNSQITQLRGDRISVFEIVADLNETPFCQIGGDRVKVRRRFDIKREQQG